jgi:hypothetical protein
MRAEVLGCGYALVVAQNPQDRRRVGAPMAGRLPRVRVHLELAPPQRDALGPLPVPRDACACVQHRRLSDGAASRALRRTRVLSGARRSSDPPRPPPGQRRRTRVPIRARAQLYRRRRRRRADLRLPGADHEHCSDADPRPSRWGGRRREPRSRRRRARGVPAGWRAAGTDAFVPDRGD